jgi:PmbA protein
MASSRFTYSRDELRAMVEGTLRIARTHGATEAEADISEGYGQSVTVRRGEVETIEYNRDKGLSVTAYVGKQRGYASSSDLSPRAIEDTVRAALSIARFTAADDCAGLAEPELIARGSRDLDLFHPWDLPVEQAIVMARECEAAALRLDKRIVNSEGATVSCQQTQFVAGNTNGFLDGYPSSRHYISCAVIAGEDDTMQRDDWYSWTRAPGDLARPEAIGDYAGRRALARLRSRKLGTRAARVLFEAPVANGLLSHFVSAVSGGSLYRKSSFLLDSLGTQVF